MAYGWVHRAAHLLANHEEQDADGVRSQYDTMLAEMARRQTEAGSLASAIGHFLTVTQSYRPGLFHCYDIPGLPRTNNVLEQFFGSARYHQRRTNGRIRATAATVVRGSVRVLASTASRLHRFGEYELRHPNLDRWRDLRQSLELRQEARRQQGRFRKDPDGYLATLETLLLKSSLPS